MKTGTFIALSSLACVPGDSFSINKSTGTFARNIRAAPVYVPRIVPLRQMDCIRNTEYASHLVAKTAVFYRENPDCDPENFSPGELKYELSDEGVGGKASRQGPEAPKGPEDPEENDESEVPGNQGDKQAPKKSRLFGLDQLGNKVRSMLRDTRDGNKMHLEIDDHLHDCYPSCPLDDMKYTMNHDDLSGRRRLSIDREFLDTDDSFYHKLMRDTVFAEWSSDQGHHESLHIKMHVTANSEGPGPLWETWLRKSSLPQGVQDEIVHIGGELRKKIFQAHEKDAIEVIFTAIGDVLEHTPKLLESQMFIHYLSDVESLHEIESVGTIGEWLEKVEQHERSGLNTQENPLSKNVEVWAGSIASLKSVGGRFVNDVLPKLVAKDAQLLANILHRTSALDLLVLMIIIAKGSKGC